MAYIALIADICQSKKLDDRSLVQDQLQIACDNINERRESFGLVSPFTITLGDEIQALFSYSDQIWVAIFELEQAMHPVRLRFGFGVGEIATKVNNASAIGMDGPAFYRARKAVEELRADNKYYRVAGLGQQEELVKHSMDLVSHQRSSWRLNRLAIFVGVLKGDTASVLSKQLGITVEAVYKNIRDGEFGAILGFLQELTDVINNQMEITDDH